jgi:hypothetical protein
VVEGGRLLFCGVLGNGLGVVGEVAGAVGRVEAFWEDDDFGVVLCGLTDEFGGFVEVGLLVGA